MENFLKHCKKCLLDTAQYKKVHVVLGNEACDLDSACSSIVYAYYLHQTKSRPDVLYLPVLNIPNVEFQLRTEVSTHLSQANIIADLLTFRDQVNLASFKELGSLELTLVDHNILPVQDELLEGAVVEVIDHHKWERPQDDSIPVTIQTTGSCCTLVAEKLLSESSFHIDHEVADLLYGVIVFDTVNLSEKAGIKTEKDVAVLTQLETLREEHAATREEICTKLSKAKADVSALTTADLLRKDLKLVKSETRTVAMASLPISIQSFLERGGVAEDLRTLCGEKSADVAILMSLVIDEDGSPLRQLAVFSENSHLRQQVCGFLADSADPPLHLTPLTSPPSAVSAYTQANITASRKKILPLVKSYVASLPLGTKRD